MTYDPAMYTITETPTFKEQASQLWDEGERSDFFAWIAQYHDAGNVIPKTGGCRKVRWSRKGTGKRGGVRVIYYNQLEDGQICMLLIYAKSVRGNIPSHILNAIRETIEND